MIPYGPSRKLPAWRSRMLPNMLGASNCGAHSQSIAPSGAIRAPVWQSERNAYSAIGGNGDTVAVGRFIGCGRVAVAGAVVTVETPVTPTTAPARGWLSRTRRRGPPS